MIEMNGEIWIEFEKEDELWLDLGDQFEEPPVGELLCGRCYFEYVSFCSALNG